MDTVSLQKQLNINAIFTCIGVASNKTSLVGKVFNTKNFEVNKIFQETSKDALFWKQIPFNSLLGKRDCSTLAMQPVRMREREGCNATCSREENL